MPNGAPTPRDVSPLLQMLRRFLQGRDPTNPLRFEPKMASRSQPPPDLPGGPAHKLNTNYYFARDARREVMPPLIVADASVKQIAGKQASEITASGKKEAVDTASLGTIVPGHAYKWKEVTDVQ